MITDETAEEIQKLIWSCFPKSRYDESKGTIVSVGMDKLFHVIGKLMQERDEALRRLDVEMRCAARRIDAD